MKNYLAALFALTAFSFGRGDAPKVLQYTTNSKISVSGSLFAHATAGPNVVDDSSGDEEEPASPSSTGGPSSGEGQKPIGTWFPINPAQGADVSKSDDVSAIAFYADFGQVAYSGTGGSASMNVKADSHSITCKTKFDADMLTITSIGEELCESGAYPPQWAMVPTWSGYHVFLAPQVILKSTGNANVFYSIEIGPFEITEISVMELSAKMSALPWDVSGTGTWELKKEGGSGFDTISGTVANPQGPLNISDTFVFADDLEETYPLGSYTLKLTFSAASDGCVSKSTCTQLSDQDDLAAKCDFELSLTFN